MFHGPCLPNQLHSRTQSHLNIAEFGSGKHETRRVPASQFERGWPVKRPVTRPFRCKTLPRKYFRLSKVAAYPLPQDSIPSLLEFQFRVEDFFSLSRKEEEENSTMESEIESGFDLRWVEEKREKMNLN